MSSGEKWGWAVGMARESWSADRNAETDRKVMESVAALCHALSQIASSFHDISWCAYDVRGYVVLRWAMRAHMCTSTSLWSEHDEMLSSNIFKYSLSFFSIFQKSFTTRTQFEPQSPHLGGSPWFYNDDPRFLPFTLIIIDLTSFNMIRSERIVHHACVARQLVARRPLSADLCQADPNRQMPKET